ELILFLYQEYGLDFIAQLRGEFSFVLYDAKKQHLIGVRDRFAIKPFCYHLTNNGDLYVASEAKAIFATGIIPQWNNYALYHSFCFQYTPQNETLFQSIYQLPAGHLLIYDGNELIIKRYWDLDFSQDNMPEKEIDESSLIQMLDEQIKEAIALRLRADNLPICCHLSGGIDSASIAAIGSQINGKPLPCFSVSFTHNLYDETAIAARLAKHIGAEFYPILVDAEDIIEVLEKAVYYSESLAINNHLAAKYILNREIKKAGFKIALTGEGSDELFLGYTHFRQDLQSQSTQELFNNNLVATGIHISNETTLSLDNIQKELGFIPSFMKAKSAMGYKLQQLLNDDFKQMFNSDNIYAHILSNLDVKNQIMGTHQIYQSAYLWIKFPLGGYILKTLADGCEMANGIEGRVPFLDHILFDFAKQIPLNFKIHQGVEKYILRETVKKYVTPEIYQRAKHPFMSPPLSMHKNQKGLTFINDCLRSNDFKNLPFFNSTKVALYLDNMTNQTIGEQIASEPVIMMMLTTFLLSQQYNL
ncbi:MAG TPA: asparagine synthase (glutamine-hydrolyzing), partial [Allocoleopsis sp.]